MGDNTGIGWCHWGDKKGATLTSIRGCKWAQYFDAAKQAWVYYDVCGNCYAQNTASRHVKLSHGKGPYVGLTKQTKRGPIWTGRVRFDEEQLLAVLDKAAPRTYFRHS